jgi:hypothetical protein
MRDVDTQCTPTALGQHIKIATRLGGLHHAEAVGMSGHIDIGRTLFDDR